MSRACHRRRRRRVAEPGEEVVGGGAAGAVPDLDVVEAAVLVTLDAERREVELNGNGHFCLCDFLGPFSEFAVCLFQKSFRSNL